MTVTEYLEQIKTARQEVPTAFIWVVRPPAKR